MRSADDAGALTRPGRGFVPLAIGEIFARLVSFGTVAYVSHVVGAPMFGIITFATALLLYAQRLVGWEFEALGIPEVVADDPEARRRINGLFAYRGAVATVLLGIVLASGAWAPRIDYRVLCFYAVGLLIVAGNARFVLLMRHRPGTAATARIIAEVVNVLTVLLLVHRPEDVVWVPAGFVAGELAGTAFMLLRLHHWPGRHGMIWPFAIERARRAVPLVMSAILGLIVFNIDLVMLRIIWGTEQAGYYGVAFSIISLVLNLGMAYNATVLPNLVRLRADTSAARRYYTNALLLFAILLGPLVVGGVVLAPDLVDGLFGVRYQPASLPLAILMFSTGIAAARFIPTSALVSLERRREVLLVNVVGAVLNVILNLMLIPRYGMVGAAASTLATDIVRTTMAGWLLRSSGFNQGPVRLYARPFAALLIMGVLAYLLRGWSIWVSVPLAGVAYALVLLALRVVRLGRDGLILGDAIRTNAG